jgi:hypothetical protein
VTAVPNRAHRFRGGSPAAAGLVGLCHRQERADRPDPQLGPRTSPVRYHREHGRVRIRPGGTPADVPDDVSKAYLASVPAGRMGPPGDIAHAVSFLVPDGAGFITGQRIVVDGGRSLGN